MTEEYKVGYEEFTTLLSSYTEVRFSVPRHEWTRLRESKEWTDFQDILEEIQREYIQKKHSIGIREERFEEKLRIGGMTMTNEQKISELIEMCEPIVEYLKKRDPHMEISITQDAIKLKAVEVGIPLGT